MSEKKYNRQTYTGLGAGMQDKLIKGAYLSARADAPDYSWMNAVSSGINAFGEEMETSKANKKAEREKVLSSIQGNMDKIMEVGGSLPEKYFDQAFDYANSLRDQYVAAVDSGDTKLQHKLKGQLNTFSTSIQTTKTSLSDAAGLWKDGSLIPESGMTPYQLSVNASINEENVELNEGSYRWRAVDPDGNPVLDKNGEQKYYTEEDYSKALPLRDDVNTEVYKKSNSTVIENREKWLNGEGGEFDNMSQRKANLKIIETSVKDMGSMQSMIHDDITGFGSFASSIDTHPSFVGYFEEDEDGKLSMFNMKDGISNVSAIALYDKDGDNSVGYEDFIDANSFPQYDVNEDGVISKEELEAVYDKDPSARQTIAKLAKEKIKNALLNPAKGQEDTTKGMLADFMTNRQKQMFYGGDERYKDLIPGVGNTTFTKATKKKKGKLIINGTEIESLEAYKILGGSYKYLQDRGYYWDPKDGGWLLNEGAQFYNSNPIVSKPKYDKK